MPIRFQVDGDFYDHPKTLGMSDAATALWVRAGSYSAAKLTDGFVADATLVRLSQTPLEAARELIRRGLWSRVKGGYRFHQWESRNLTRARVEVERQADRIRKAKVRQSTKNEGNPQVEGHSVRSESGPESGRSPDGVRPLSVSVSVSESVSGSGHGSASPPTVVSDPPPLRCQEHAQSTNPPPCGPCAEARKAHDTWRIAARQRQETAPRCRLHRGQLAATCGPCRAELKGAA